MSYDYLFVLYYLTVLGYTKTTTHISISALLWIFKWPFYGLLNIYFYI